MGRDGGRGDLRAVEQSQCQSVDCAAGGVGCGVVRQGRRAGWQATQGAVHCLRSGDEAGVHAGAGFGLDLELGMVELASSRSPQLPDQAPRSPSCLDGIV